MEHQRAIERGLEPGLPATVVAQAAVGVLGPPEDIQAHSQIGISHGYGSARSALTVRSKESSGTIETSEGAVLARTFYSLAQWFILESNQGNSEDQDQ
jgi:hypothetical protein